MKRDRSYPLVMRRWYRPLEHECSTCHRTFRLEDWLPSSIIRKEARAALALWLPWRSVIKRQDLLLELSREKSKGRYRNTRTLRCVRVPNDCSNRPDHCAVPSTLRAAASDLSLLCGELHRRRPERWLHVPHRHQVRLLALLAVDRETFQAKNRTTWRGLRECLWIGRKIE